MEKIMLNNSISKEKAYVLKELKEGDRIPIVSDTMFHTMLNNSSRKKYAAYLISLVLDVDYNKIYDSLVFMNNKLDKSKNNDSSKTVDFVCKIDNEIIGIEMNNNGVKAVLERNISYGADLYKSRMIKGSPYEYQKVIQININNFTFLGNSNIIEKYSIKNEEGIELTDKLQFIYIYLPNIRKKCYNKEELNELERLLLVFNEESNLKELCGGNEIMEEYVKESQEASTDDEVIGLYDRELHLEKLKFSEIQEARYEASKEGREEGIKEGIKEGRKEGRKEGIKEGIKEGRVEKQIEIAKELLKNQVDIDIIVSSTGLTREKVENLE